MIANCLDLKNAFVPLSTDQPRRRDVEDRRKGLLEEENNNESTQDKGNFHELNRNQQKSQTQPNLHYSGATNHSKLTLTSDDVSSGDFDFLEDSTRLEQYDLNISNDQRNETNTLAFHNAQMIMSYRGNTGSYDDDLQESHESDGSLTDDTTSSDESQRSSTEDETASDNIIIDNSRVAPPRPAIVSPALYQPDRVRR